MSVSSSVKRRAEESKDLESVSRVSVLTPKTGSSVSVGGLTRVERCEPEEQRHHVLRLLEQDLAGAH